MQINVGPFVYQIQIYRGPIPHEGQDCCGLCDNINQVIYISDQLPRTQRLQVFFHELMHAWWYHFGLDATNEESIVDLIGMAMTDFMLQAAKSLKRQIATPPTPATSATTTADLAKTPDFLRFIEPGLQADHPNQSMLMASLRMLDELNNKPTAQQQLPAIVQQLHEQQKQTSDSQTKTPGSRSGVDPKMKTPESGPDRKRKTPGSGADGKTNTPGFAPDRKRNTPGSGFGAKGKAQRMTHVYEPAQKLNPLTPIHAIRHGEWVVKIYDPEVEDEDFAA